MRGIVGTISLHGETVALTLAVRDGHRAPFAHGDSIANKWRRRNSKCRYWNPHRSVYDMNVIGDALPGLTAIHSRRPAPPTPDPQVQNSAQSDPTNQNYDE